MQANYPDITNLGNCTSGSHLVGPDGRYILGGQLWPDVLERLTDNVVDLICEGRNPAAIIKDLLGLAVGLLECNELPKDWMSGVMLNTLVKLCTSPHRGDWANIMLVD